MLGSMKIIALFILIFMSTISYSQVEFKSKDSDKKDTDEPIGIKMSDGILYGKDYDQSMTIMEFNNLMNSIAENNGKVVLVTGSVSEVCQKMGCWMTMSDGTNTTRVKTLHEFFLPKDIAGRNAVVIGTFKVTEISEDQAKHYNDESKNPKIKTEDISGPQEAYEIEAIGIKILNPETDSK